MLRERTLGPGRERGQATVIFALLIPVIFALGAIVLDLGNFYIHKRHLQTQVDAAALAGGGLFSGCFTGDPAFKALTNVAIRDEAEKYAGDKLRDTSTVNTQLQEPGDVRVVLNSSNYWDPVNGVSSPSTGYGLDDSIATPGDPCSLLELDAKATDEDAPMLWGLIPVHPDPKSHAKVQIQQARGIRILPWAVPEVDPLFVTPIFIDEETGEVLCLPAGSLTKQTLPSGDPRSQFSVWEGDVGCEPGPQFNVSSQNIGVIVLVSKHPNPALPNIGATPPYTCNQAPRRWNCYAGSTGDGSSSLTFIHGYDDEGVGTVAQPVVKDVQLTPGSCTSASNLSAPYFVLNGACNVGVQAVIDFGSASPTGDPRDFPTCAIVEVSPGGTPLDWTPGGLGGPLGTWSSSGYPIALAADSGRTVVDLDWWSGPKRPPNPPVACGTSKSQRQQSGSFPKVAAPYVADEDPSEPADSGPVRYLKLSTVGGLGNSLPDGPGPTIHVEVGLKPTLTSGQLVGLRISSDTPSSKTQAIDCDKNIRFEDEIADGCRTPHELNYYDWDNDTTTPNSWRDIECLSYDQSAPSPPSPGFRYTLPVDAPYNPSPRPDCGKLEPGVRNGDFGKGMHARFESPCTDVKYPNGWATPEEKANDPRWVILVITDATAFEGAGASPGDTIPVKILGGFYVAGWTAVASATGCPQNQPPPPGAGNNPNRGDVWGYFDKVVNPGGGDPSGKKCSTAGFEVCIAVLVE
jgi:hypothetical protein